MISVRYEIWCRVVGAKQTRWQLLRSYVEREAAERNLGEVREHLAISEVDIEYELRESQ